jgi:8-amino-7-oxononanoate synthase
VLIVSDELNHASLIDACRLSRARIQITPHRDPATVQHALASRNEPAALIVTDAVFSVAGDLAPLNQLHQAARIHQALLVIDEAHSFGVLGQGGRGAAHAAGIAEEPDVVRTITLSKSLAGQGGAVLGAEEIIDTLIDTGRSFIFDTGLAPPCAGAALEALRVLQEDPSRGQRAHANARKLATIATDLGLNTSQADAAVIRIVLGEPDAAVHAKKVCAAEGVHVGCFRPPSVPPGQAALRLTARATMTEGDFATASRALAAVRDHIRITA